MADGEKKADPLALMEDAAQFVATMCGLKAQFVAAGWREYTAELMVIELFRKTEPVAR